MFLRSFLSLLAVAAAVPAVAGPNYRYVHRPEADVYFGHISWCQLQNDADDPRVLRAEGPQRATVNLPLAPGDTLQTTAGRRCEAQFDTGTLLRVDEKTALLIETILAPSLTSKDKLTNLHLRSGRLIVLYRDYDAREVFQILTANAAVKLSRAAVVDIQTNDDGETVIELQRGQASLMYGATPERTETRKLKSGERVTVTPEHTLALALTGKTEDAFQGWNRHMNERFAELHAGKSELPKPIERFPRAVIHFAQRFGDPHGEWLWSELYGYVWRPYRSQDEGWRPYLQGRWVPMSGRQFWVPDEPWGWVPYHLGLWHFDKKHGWVWLPGSAFAPAWVSWGMCDETRYFRPLTLWDWSYRYAYGYRYRPYGYGYGGYGFANDCGYFPYWQNNQQVVVVRLQEQAPTPAPTPLPIGGDDKGPIPRKVPELPLLPLPKELETLAKKAEVLQQRTEPALRELVERGGGNVPAARNDKEERLADVARAEAAEQGTRFRDWNRDVKAAREVGGHIVYSSVTNLVRCESCSRPLINFDFFARSGGPDGTGSHGGSNNGSSGSNGGSSGGASMSGVASGGASAGGAPMAGLVSGDRKQD